MTIYSGLSKIPHDKEGASPEAYIKTFKASVRKFFSYALAIGYILLGIFIVVGAIECNTFVANPKGFAACLFCFLFIFYCLSFLFAIVYFFETISLSTKSLAFIGAISNAWRKFQIWAGHKIYSRQNKP